MTVSTAAVAARDIRRAQRLGSTFPSRPVDRGGREAKVAAPAKHICRRMGCGLIDCDALTPV